MAVLQNFSLKIICDKFPFQVPLSTALLDAGGGGVWPDPPSALSVKDATTNYYGCFAEF